MKRKLSNTEDPQVLLDLWEKTGLHKTAFAFALGTSASTLIPYFERGKRPPMTLINAARWVCQCRGIPITLNRDQVRRVMCGLPPAPRE